MKSVPAELRWKSLGRNGGKFEESFGERAISEGRALLARAIRAIPSVQNVAQEPFAEVDINNGINLSVKWA